MGCCFSKNSASTKRSRSTVLGSSKKTLLKPPIPSLVIEEETVKEVLSETPALKTPQPLPLPNPLSMKQEEEEGEEENKNTDHLSVTQDSSEEVVSELYSLSESVSTVTAITEKKKDEVDEVEEVEEEVKQKKFDKVVASPAKSARRKRSLSSPVDLTGRPEWGCGSPARRSPLSPGRVKDSAVKSEVGGHFRRKRSTDRNLAMGSGRKSRSPATSPAKVGRSPSRGTGRTPSTALGNSRKWKDSSDGKRPANESLENPLVSLECFIFL